MMDRVILFILMVTLMLGAFSCAPKKGSILPGSRYLVLEMGGEYCENHLGSHKDEVVFETDCELKNELQNTTKSIEFMGNSYEGEYKYSFSGWSWSVGVHVFNGEECSFQIDSSTGKLMKLSVNESSVKEKISNAERENIAKQVLVEITDDHEAYELIETINRVFVFCRLLDGYKTTDQIHIEIGWDGTFKGFAAYTVDKFKTISTPANYDKTEVEKAVLIKLDSIYDEVKKEHYVNYVNTDIMFVLLGEKLTVYCKVNVDIENAIEGTDASGEKTLLPEGQMFNLWLFFD